jgi:hypothetical protein
MLSEQGVDIDDLRLVGASRCCSANPAFWCRFLPRIWLEFVVLSRVEPTSNSDGVTVSRNYLPKALLGKKIAGDCVCPAADCVALGAMQLAHMCSCVPVSRLLHVCVVILP